MSSRRGGSKRWAEDQTFPKKTKHVFIWVSRGKAGGRNREPNPWFRRLKNVSRDEIFPINVELYFFGICLLWYLLRRGLSWASPADRCCQREPPSQTSTHTRYTIPPLHYKKRFTTRKFEPGVTYLWVSGKKRNSVRLETRTSKVSSTLLALAS